MTALFEVKTKRKPGQAMLLLVLVALVASLGLALSVANRSKLHQRGSTYNVQGEQAYSAAESGLDAMLDYFGSISSGKPSCANPKSITEPIGTGSYTVTYECVQGRPGASLKTEKINIKKDIPEVFYLNKKISRVKIYWKNQNNSTPGLEINLYDNSTSATTPFKQVSYNWFGQSIIGSNLVNPSFDLSTKSSVVTLSSLNDYDLLQITARTADANDVYIEFITVNPGDRVPLQGYMIVSTGTAGKSRRVIRAFYRPAHIGNLINNIFYTPNSPQ